MRYPAAETAEKHQRILDEATRLFKERGFDGVSVSEIMKATGLTHGPFYNHFDSKEALMAECITRSGDTALAELDAAGETGEGIRAYVDTYLSTDHRDGRAGGCLVAAFAAQAGSESSGGISVCPTIGKRRDTRADRRGSTRPTPGISARAPSCLPVRRRPSAAATAPTGTPEPST